MLLLGIDITRVGRAASIVLTVGCRFLVEFGVLCPLLLPALQEGAAPP